MRKVIERFYLRKGVLIFFGIAAMLGWLSWTVSTYVTGDPIKLPIFGCVCFLLTGGLILAFLKGATNVQKMLFGSLLLFLVIDYIEIVEMFFTYYMDLISVVIVNTITLVVLIVFYVCHLLQQLDHVGSKIIIAINQCCGSVIALIILYLILNIILGTSLVSDYTFCVAISSTMFLVICMETRISTYKEIRAKHIKDGDWNDITRAEAKKLFKL